MRVVNKFVGVGKNHPVGQSAAVCLVLGKEFFGPITVVITVFGHGQKSDFGVFYQDFSGGVGRIIVPDKDSVGDCFVMPKPIRHDNFLVIHVGIDIDLHS